MPANARPPSDLPVPRLFIAFPGSTVELDSHHAGLPLPQGPDQEAPLLFYGPYLEGIAAFLQRDEYRALFTAHARCFGVSLPPGELREVSLISEKHGAFYNVARVRLLLSSGEVSFAVSTAASEAQKAAMARETAALKALEGQAPEGLIPRVLCEGEAPYAAGNEPARSLGLFMAEWYEGFHEFHLAAAHPHDATRIALWDGQPTRHFLRVTEAAQLYRAAARLLTLCYEWRTGRQIYPWHHAAGDFVARTDRGPVDVRLITVRDYRRLVPDDGAGRNPLLDLIHFFANLTVRMRLDRLDGTGPLAWGDIPCVEACLTGFLEGCSGQHAASPSFPDAPDILDLLKSFDASDLLDLLGAVLPDGLIEPDEEHYLIQHLVGHVHELAEALRRAPGFS